jgi:glutathione synthase/RimK-type ligase-like ATP-grasp enzyme
LVHLPDYPLEELFLSIDTIKANRRILITGGRAPTALDIARKLNSQGHTIYVVDSIKYNLCRYSKAVKKCYISPSPSSHELDYIDTLLRIIETHLIDLIIPTCEEAFYLSKHKEKFKNRTKLCSDNIETLKRLHNKQQFNELIIPEGKIRKPQTCLIHNHQEYKQEIEAFNKHSVIIKPVYSRFGGKVRLLSSKKELPSDIKLSNTNPWLVQEYVHGRTLSTYAICFQGTVLQNVIYHSRYTTSEHGAGVYFSKVHNDAIEKWISRFVKEINYTGQIAFDLIEQENGSIWPLECNPRSTSGIHLLSAEMLEKAFIENKYVEKNSILTDEKQLILPMLIYAFSNIKRTKAPLLWLRKFFTSGSIIFSWKDTLPFFSQITMLIELLKRKFRHKITLLEATTYDIEWNGDE